MSFEETYGSMAEEISFEYLFFVKHIEQGFRADLCSWDWKKKPKLLIDRQVASTRVAAGRGWQPSGVTLKGGHEYEYSVAGTWQVADNKGEVTADGASDGRGRLVGVVMKNFQLSEPFPLGAYGKFVAPGDGHLYLRCQCGWGEIADNKGGVTAKLKLAGFGDPLPRPPAPASKDTTKAKPVSAKAVAN